MYDIINIIIIIEFTIGPPSIEFCGRRLHVNRSFSLILTTRVSPDNIPHNSVMVYNMTTSLPLCQSHLLHKTRYGSTISDNNETHSSINHQLSTDYGKVEVLNENLLEQFYKMEDGESVMVTVDRVQQTMADMMKVIGTCMYMYIYTHIHVHVWCFYCTCMEFYFLQQHDIGIITCSI